MPEEPLYVRYGRGKATRPNFSRSFFAPDETLSQTRASFLRSTARIKIEFSFLN
jgi:hypothetical protein